MPRLPKITEIIPKISDILPKLITEEKVTLMQNKPAAFAALVFCAFMGFFVNKFTSSTDNTNEQCEKRVLSAERRADIAEQRADQSDMRMYQTQRELLIKNGILNDIINNTDSVFRKKVGEPVKQILDENKK